MSEEKSLRKWRRGGRDSGSWEDRQVTASERREELAGSGSGGMSVVGPRVVVGQELLRT